MRLLPRLEDEQKSGAITSSYFVPIPKSFLNERVGKLSAPKLREVEEGVRLVLAM